MRDLANISIGQMNRVMWFIDTMENLRKLKEEYLPDLDTTDNDEIIKVLDICGGVVSEEMPSSYDGDYSVGLWQSEEESIKKFKNLYENWSLTPISQGRALESIIEDFYDRYGKVYSHIRITGERPVLGAKRVFVESKNEYTDIKVALSCKDIGIYRDQFVDGGYRGGYYSEDTFYRIKIKDEWMKRYYEKFRNYKDAMMLFKYLIQVSIRLISSYGEILGVNMYDGIDYIDILVASSYGRNEGTLYETYYHIEDSITIVDAYMLKEIIKKTVREV